MGWWHSKGNSDKKWRRWTKLEAFTIYNKSLYLSIPSAHSLYLSKSSVSLYFSFILSLFCFLFFLFCFISLSSLCVPFFLWSLLLLHLPFLLLYVSTRPPLFSFSLLCHNVLKSLVHFKITEILVFQVHAWCNSTFSFFKAAIMWCWHNERKANSCPPVWLSFGNYSLTMLDY